MVYDRKAAAKRLKKKRIELRLSAPDVAHKIDKAPRYYWDIERGVCGMSVETLISLAECLDLSVDYILFGDDQDQADGSFKAACRLLNQCNDETRQNAVALLKTFIDLSEKK